MLADQEIITTSEKSGFNFIFAGLMKLYGLEVWKWWEDSVEVSIGEAECVDVVNG